MDFLRLHLPGLHQALRGALDSLSTFVSYLMGDEVPTVERREAQAAAELGENSVEEEAQEALEGLGGNQNKEDRRLRALEESERCHEDSSASEQTWGWEEGSSHGSQEDRQDSGTWEAARTSRCQKPNAPLETDKESEAGSGVDQYRNSQIQESEEPSEQEMNRKETLRTWEQKEEEEKEEEEEEVSEREPGVTGGAESEWTWHGEPEWKVSADGQKVAGDIKETVAEDTPGSGIKGHGREEEAVVIVRGGQSTKAQGTWELGEESENWETLDRQKTWTTSGREEVWTSDREEAGTNSGREEAWVTSGREEAGTTSDREESWTTSGREESWVTSGREEARTTSGGAESWVTSGREEAGTPSDREESWATSGREEAGTSSDREESWATSGREEAGTPSDREESWATSGREEAGTPSDREEADFLGAGETEDGAVSGEIIPEGTKKVWNLEEDLKGDKEEVVDEKREAEVSLFPKQTQVLGTEGVEDEVRDQTGRELAGQESEGEVGEAMERQADQGGEETRGRYDTEIRTAQVSLEEVVQAAEASEEKGSCWTTEDELFQDKEATKTEGDSDTEAIPEAAIPEARPEEFTGERSEEEVQLGQETLGVQFGDPKHEATESQEPEQMGEPLTPTKQPEEGQGYEEELWNIPALSKGDLEREREEYPNTMWHVKSDSSGAEQRRDTEGGNAQEQNNAESGEEDSSGGQVPEAVSAGGLKCALAEIPEEADGEKKAKETEEGGEEGEAPGGENDLGGRRGAGAGTDQSEVGESDVRETQDEEVGAVMPWGTGRMSGRGCSLEGAPSPQDALASPLPAEMVEDEDGLERRAEDVGEGPEREAGDGWEGAFGREEEVMETAKGENVGEQGFGLEGSAEELTDRDDQAGASEDGGGEPWGGQAEAGDSGRKARSCRAGAFTLGSAGAQETVTILEAEGLQGGQLLLEKEAGDWQVGVQGQGREGQFGDHTPEREARSSLEGEDVMVTGDWRAELEEIDPEGLEAVQNQEGQLMTQTLEEGEPGLRGEAEGSADGDAGGSWCEALLPASRLDVSVPRSRVLLSRSSSQRRSRPSFRRTPAPEQQEQPPSPPSEEEEVSAPEQQLPQPTEPRESSPPRPEGIPVPARRRPLGHGFGLAHSGMMQELQARLRQPKPQ